MPAQNGEKVASDAVDTVNKTVELIYQEKGPASDPQHCKARLIPGVSIPVHAAMQGNKPIDPEQVFLHRLRQRHGNTVHASALVQCIAGELKSWRDWADFLVFDERQTTAPELLKNPPGHYRQPVRKFYAARAQKRD